MATRRTITVRTHVRTQPQRPRFIRTADTRNEPRDWFNPRHNDVLSRVYHLGRVVPN